MEISRILAKIENKEIVVPQFQREYIWNKQQAKDLLTSLYRLWPTGSLLFWRIKKNKSPPLKNVEIKSDDASRIDLILDGQQRLTALYLLIRGKIPPYYEKNEIIHDPRDLYFNILNEAFKYYQKTEMEKDPSWQNVTWFFNADEAKINKLIEKLEIKTSKDHSSTV